MQSGHELVDELVVEESGKYDEHRRTHLVCSCLRGIDGTHWTAARPGSGRPGHGAIHRVACHNDLDNTGINILAPDHTSPSSCPPHTATPISSEGWLPESVQSPRGWGR